MLACCGVGGDRAIGVLLLFKAWCVPFLALETFVFNFHGVETPETTQTGIIEGICAWNC